MRTSDGQIHELLATSGVVGRRDHPELARALSRLAADGRVVAVLPGVYAPPAEAGSWRTRVRALHCWAPDAVLIGGAAARLTFWPELRADVVGAALPHRRRAPRGFAFSRRRIPAELVSSRAGLRLTCPALTALDLCLGDDGDAIDRVLRARAATLTGLHEALALTADRTGNPGRRRLLLDSRDEPWSAAERRAHRLLHEAGITGWRANRLILVGERVYYPDVLFEAERVVLEIDGRLHEIDPAVFENDRLRQNDLVLEGFRVLRFTWRMLVDRPEDFVAAVRRVLEEKRPPSRR